VIDFETAKRQILDRVRIEDVVGEQVRLRRSGPRWVGLCPFHSEKTPSFAVNPDLGIFKCFGCGKGGDVFTFVQLRDRVDFMDSLRLLADRAGVTLPTRSGSSQAAESGPNRVDLLKAAAWGLTHFRSNLLNPTVGRSAREYLQHRGFSEATVERFGLGLASESAGAIRAAATRAGFDEAALLGADLIRADEQGRTYETFRDRLMFPIRDASGRVIGFGGRTLVDDKAKYLNTRQTTMFDKGRTLYGLDVARDAITSAGRAVVVEGYTDCIACHQAGFAETVATLGTALTEAHVDQLRRFSDEIILLFDSDAAGEAAADRAIGVALPRCVKVRLARVPDGKDPGEFLPRAGAAAFSDVLNGAVEALEFRWSATQRRFAGDASDASRREAVLDFMRVVRSSVDSRAMDAIQCGLMVNQIAHLLKIERADVARLLNKPATPRRADGPGESEGGDGPVEAAPRSARQAAWTHLLEVALNRPELLAAVELRPDAGQVADPRDRRIAEALWEALATSSSVTIADVLVRCGDPNDAARAVELVERGAARGNFEATLALCLERIGATSRDDEAARRRREWLRPVVDSATPEQGKETDRVLSESVKEHRHFVPRRFRRRDDDARGGSVEETVKLAP